MDQLPNVLRALSDISRLRILNILSYQCLCVCDLQAVLGLSQTLVSRHLASLRHAGLVKDRRGGTWVCYSPALDATYGRAVRSFLRDVLRLTPSLQADLENLRQCGSLGKLKYRAVAGDAEQRAASRETRSGVDSQPVPGESSMVEE